METFALFRSNVRARVLLNSVSNDRRLLLCRRNNVTGRELIGPLFIRLTPDRDGA